MDLFIYHVIFTQEYPISVQHCSPTWIYHFIIVSGVTDIMILACFISTDPS